MRKFIKNIIALIFLNYIEFSIAGLMSKFSIILPLTFLGYSLYIYRFNTNISPISAFLVGLFVDLIQGSYFGLNATLFCIITYLIQSYSNKFKIFSYLQICLFFGLSGAGYVGFTQLVLSLYNFSYLTLIISTIFNIVFCFSVVIFSSFFPKIFRLEK
jgi:rod shape-determining protein MreD